MKTCSHCKHVNLEIASLCESCGKRLTPPANLPTPKDSLSSASQSSSEQSYRLSNTAPLGFSLAENDESKDDGTLGFGKNMTDSVPADPLIGQQVGNY